LRGVLTKFIFCYGVFCPINLSSASKRSNPLKTGVRNEEYKKQHEANHGRYLEEQEMKRGKCDLPCVLIL
ncbi:hypothetical protein T4B_11990, partial [Trichinella pseudospiralis]